MKKSHLIIIIIATIIILAIFGGVLEAKAELRRYKAEIQKLQFKNQEFEETIIEDEKRLAQQAQIMLSQKDAIEMGLLEINNLKKVKSQVRIITKTQIDSLIITHSDTVTIEKRPDGNYLKLPQTYTLVDEWMVLGSTINKDGLLIDSLQIFNSYSITIATKSGGLFKKPIPIVQLINDNPYTQTTNMQNIIIRDEKKFYDKKGFWFGTGALIAFLLPIIK